MLAHERHLMKRLVSRSCQLMGKWLQMTKAVYQTWINNVAEDLVMKEGTEWVKGASSWWKHRDENIEVVLGWKMKRML